MAVAKAHPVPWVELDRWRSALKASCSIPCGVVKLNRSMAFSRCPPVMTTADGAHVVKLRGRGFHFVQVRHLEPGNDGGFIDIRGHHVRQGNEAIDQQLDARSASRSSAPEEDFSTGSSTTLGSRARVCWPAGLSAGRPRRQEVGKGLHYLPEPSMPMWTAAISTSATSSSRVSVEEGRVDSFDPLDPGGGLHRHGGDARHAVAAMGGNRLDVGGHAGSGRGIEPRDGEYDGWFFGHGSSVPRVR